MMFWVGIVCFVACDLLLAEAGRLTLTKPVLVKMKEMPGWLTATDAGIAPLTKGI